MKADAFSQDYIADVLDLVKSRAELLPDLWGQADFFFIAPEAYAEKDVKKRWKPETPELMTGLIKLLETLPDLSPATAEPVVMQWIANNGLHTGNVMNAFRLALVGRCTGPHIFEITQLLGSDETIRRVRRAVAEIKVPEA